MNALSACNLSRKVEWSNWSRSRRGAGNAIREEEARLVFARRAVTWWTEVGEGQRYPARAEMRLALVMYVMYTWVTYTYARDSWERGSGTWCRKPLYGQSFFASSSFSYSATSGPTRIPSGRRHNEPLTYNFLAEIYDGYPITFWVPRQLMPCLISLIANYNEMSIQSFCQLFSF